MTQGRGTRRGAGPCKLSLALISAGENGSPLPSRTAQIEIQVARVLEDIKTLHRTYGPMLSDAGPDIEQALRVAAAALDEVVSRSPAAAPPPDQPAGGRGL